MNERKGGENLTLRIRRDFLEGEIKSGFLFIKMAKIKFV